MSRGQSAQWPRRLYESIAVEYIQTLVQMNANHESFVVFALLIVFVQLHVYV